LIHRTNYMFVIQNTIYFCNTESNVSFLVTARQTRVIGQEEAGKPRDVQLMGTTSGVSATGASMVCEISLPSTRLRLKSRMIESVSSMLIGPDISKLLDLSSTSFVLFICHIYTKLNSS